MRYAQRQTAMRIRNAASENDESLGNFVKSPLVTQVDNAYGLNSDDVHMWACQGRN